MLWNVGNGELIQLWADRWVPGIQGGKVSPLPNIQCSDMTVEEFINPNTRSWNVEMLKHCISETQVTEVCKIPISMAGGKDKLIWKHNNFGAYTVKSGYVQQRSKLTKVNSSKPSCSYVPSSSLWKKLWCIPTLPKIRMFIWRVLKNWVACRDNLVKRRCGTNPTCPICGTTSETIEHLLFHCPWSKAIWFGSNKGF